MAKNKNKNINAQFKNAIIIDPSKLQTPKAKASDIKRPAPEASSGSKEVQVSVTDEDGIVIRIIENKPEQQLYQRGMLFWSVVKKEFYMLVKPMVSKELLPVPGQPGVSKETNVSYFNLVNMKTGAMVASIVQTLKESCVCTLDDWISVEALNDRYGLGLVPHENSAECVTVTNNKTKTPTLENGFTAGLVTLMCG